MKTHLLPALFAFGLFASVNAHSAQLKDFQGEFTAKGNCKIREASVSVDPKGAPSIAVNLFERPGGHPEFGGMPTFGSSFYDGATYRVNNSYYEGQSVKVSGNQLLAETFFMNPRETKTRVVLQLTSDGLRIQWPYGSCSFQRKPSASWSFGSLFSHVTFEEKAPQSENQAPAEVPAPTNELSAI